MNILITGANGFMGQNLVASLQENVSQQGDVLFAVDVDTPTGRLADFASQADFVFHLAGVNRPLDTAEYQQGNANFTAELLLLLEKGTCPPVLLSSSTQASLSNPYGVSKRAAEEAVFAYGKRNHQAVMVYRLTNAFGKWSRPHYNSVVATFCYNIARGLPVQINDPDYMLRLNYIDDILAEFLRALQGTPTRQGDFCAVHPEHCIPLGQLATQIQAFRDGRDQLDLPDQTDPLTRKLYATYLSFLPPDDFARIPTTHSDSRGSFTELLHMGGYGQVSVNISKPFITKGEHWHHTKHEKFAVVAGRGVIRFRKINSTEILSYPVSGNSLSIVDIPPGYTHNIENLGDTDMVTLMWANERLDPGHPDTYRLPVALEPEN